MKTIVSKFDNIDIAYEILLNQAHTHTHALTNVIQTYEEEQKKLPNEMENIVLNEKFRF